MALTTVSFTFQDPSGAPLAGGRVELHLNYDISTSTSGGVQVVGGRTITETLDNNGSASPLVWPNDQLFPANSVYFVTAYSSVGQPVWSGEVTVSGEGDLLLETGDPILLEVGGTSFIELES